MKNIFAKIFILMLVNLLISVNSQAQQYLFKILTYAGKVDYRTSSTQSWKKVQAGESFAKDCEVRLDRNSYAALMFNDGRTMEMQDEGIFAINDLEQNMRSSKISVTQKFAKFVAQEIITDKTEKKDMKTFAAVVRVKPNHIDAAIPSSTSVLDPVIDFSWYNYPSTKQYIFSVLNSSGTAIFMDLVNDTTYRIDAEKLKLNRGTVYKWHVSDADNPKIISDTNAFNVLSNDNRTLIIDTIQMLKEEIESNETPLNVLSLCSFFERNNLNVEALKNFDKAFVLAPESEEYKKLFARFLLNNKLYLRATELLEEK